MSQRPNVPATHGVFSVHHGGCEHVGSRESCEQWIRNAASQGFIRASDYEVLPAQR
jgi:hypothetical protein